LPGRDFIPTRPKKERCVLVGLSRGAISPFSVQDNLDELAALAKTAGAKVIDRFIQNRPLPDPAFFIGRGKVEELAIFVNEHDIDLLIFDDELTPGQIKNLENLLDVKVIDRAALILDIFAAHAMSREARTQVELAQLRYLLPRLTGHWSHLSRQVGGIGTKGPGETQLETDRRLVRNRISKLKEELNKIDRQRTVQRRKANEFIRVALVGYTNAGKSTLMNALTKSNTYVEDKLFATLDTTVRRLYLEKTRFVLLTDTVGFIRKLPYDLVASFQSTLAQTKESDYLLQVVDISHPQFEDHIGVVHDILIDLKLEETPMVLIFNKVDRITDTNLLRSTAMRYPDALFVSASKCIRIDSIRKRLSQILPAKMV
jgi:GTP-binding protein HflX